MSEPRAKKQKTHEEETFHEKTNRLLVKFCNDSGFDIKQFAESKSFEEYILHLNASAKLPQVIVHNVPNLSPAVGYVNETIREPVVDVSSSSSSPLKTFSSQHFQEDVDFDPVPATPIPFLASPIPCPATPIPTGKRWGCIVCPDELSFNSLCVNENNALAVFMGGIICNTVTEQYAENKLRIHSLRICRKHLNDVFLWVSTAIGAQYENELPKVPKEQLSTPFNVFKRMKRVREIAEGKKLSDLPFHSFKSLLKTFLHKYAPAIGSAQYFLNQKTRATPDNMQYDSLAHSSTSCVAGIPSQSTSLPYTTEPIDYEYEGMSNADNIHLEGTSSTTWAYPVGSNVPVAVSFSREVLGQIQEEGEATDFVLQTPLNAEDDAETKPCLFDDNGQEMVALQREMDHISSGNRPFVLDDHGIMIPRLSDYVDRPLTPLPIEDNLNNEFVYQNFMSNGEEEQAYTTPTAPTYQTIVFDDRRVRRASSLERYFDPTRLVSSLYSYQPQDHDHSSQQQDHDHSSQQQDQDHSSQQQDHDLSSQQQDHCQPPVQQSRNAIPTTSASNQSAPLNQTEVPAETDPQARDTGITPESCPTTTVATVQRQMEDIEAKLEEDDIAVMDDGWVHDNERIGPTNVTVGIIRRPYEGEYLVVSTHSFRDYFVRATTIYVMKLAEGEDQFHATFRRIMKQSYLENVKIHHLVAQEDKIFRYLFEKKIAKQFLSFSRIISVVPNNLLKLTEFTDIFKSLETMIRRIANTPKQFNAFKKAQLKRRKDPVLPQVKLSNSWMESWLCLTKILEQRDVLMTRFRSLRCKRLTLKGNWDILSFIQRVLKTCVQLSVEMSKPNNSISQVLPALARLKDAVEDKSRPASLVKVGYHFYNFYKGIFMRQWIHSYRMATALDPRYAFETVTSETDWPSMQNNIIKEFADAQGYVSSRLTRNVCLPTFEELETQIKKECTEYCSLLSVQENRLSPEMDPIQWWQDKEFDFPCLSSLAIEYLACPATSADGSVCWEGDEPGTERLLKLDPKHCWKLPSSRYYGIGRASDEMSRYAGIEKIGDPDAGNADSTVS